VCDAVAGCQLVKVLTEELGDAAVLPKRGMKERFGLLRQKADGAPVKVAAIPPMQVNHHPSYHHHLLLLFLLLLLLLLLIKLVTPRNQSSLQQCQELLTFRVVCVVAQALPDWWSSVA
jgi:hypothetical protein